MAILKTNEFRKIIGYLVLNFCLMIFINFPNKLFAQNESKSSETKPINMLEYASSHNTTIFALRLKPDQYLRNELEAFAKEHNIQAGYIITTVGSLKAASIRLADQNKPTNYIDKYEIVSLVGTISIDGVHLHISIADKNGNTIGGHLVEGCKIYTTAEIIIGNVEGVIFSREQDEQTGYKELKIKQK